MSDPKRTRFAIQAINLADSFNAAFSAERVTGGVHSYRVELSAPEGMSTAGGKQATQHVKLIPDDGGPTLVAGSANFVEQWAELRSWKQMKELHAQRFKGAPLELDRAQYDALVAKMTRFVTEYNCTLRSGPAPKPARRDQATPAGASGGASGTLVIALILLAALASASGIVYFFRHR